jgi:hypothetical protein
LCPMPIDIWLQWLSCTRFSIAILFYFFLIHCDARATYDS